MKRIDTATAVADKFGAGKNGFTDGDVVGGVPATDLNADLFDNVQEEICNVIEGAGIALNGAVKTQLATAIAAMISGAHVAVQGNFSNLRISANGTAATITVSCDELVLGNGAGVYVVERGIAGAITTTVTGAGGLDTGLLAASSWYSLWRIGKTDGTRAFLFSLSATAPTMPATYTLKARIGWFYTDATANKYPLPFIQYGEYVKYKPAAGSNLTGLRVMASGGSVGTPGTTLVAVATGAFVPPTAVEIAINSIVNPGGLAQISSSPVAVAYQGSMDAPVSPSSGWRQFLLGLESANVYWATSSTSMTLYAAGWKDNL